MKKAALAALAVAVALPCTGVGGTAAAQPHRGDYGRDRQDYAWQGDHDHRDWDPAQHYDGRRHGERRLSRNDYVYRGHDGRYYCKRSDGTTGLVVGGIAGGLLGNAIGGDTLGTLLGAAGGAALGRSIERGQVRCR